MLREVPRLVPWTSWDEWKQVSAWLWSENEEERILGLKRVAAWKARGKIPVSVELTANFVEVLKSDETVITRAVRMAQNTSGSENVRSELEKRMLYSMTLTRMVNGLVAPYQQSYRAKSIAGICQMLSLPIGLVEIRHEAAHAEIPNLTKLRSVSHECMNWLYNRYWLMQATYFENVKSTTIQRSEKLAKLRKRLTAENSLQRPEHAENQKEYKSIVNQLINELTSHQVLSCLVPELTKLIVPTQLQLSQLSRKYSEVPRRLQTMWMHIISKFAHHWPVFLPALLVSLMQNLFEATQLLPEFNLTLTPSDVQPNEVKITKYKISLLKCWYELLLDVFFETSLSSAQVDAATQSASEDVEPVPVTVKKEVKRKDPSNPQGKLPNSLLPYRAILHLCFQHMNKHSVKFIKRTICYMSASPERDAILPKLKTLFHFRSRALNLTRSEQALASGGSMERALELQRRADVNAQLFEAKTSLSLEDFEKLLAARSSPAASLSTVAIMSPAPSPFRPSDSTSRILATTTPTSTILKRDVSGLRISSPAADTLSDSPINTVEENESGESIYQSHSTPIPPTPINSLPVPTNPREALWTPVENIFPGIGLTPDGKSQVDLALPTHLDDFRGAIFLVPVAAPSISTIPSPSQITSKAPYNTVENMEDPTAIPLSPERQLLNTQGLVKRPSSQMGLQSDKPDKEDSETPNAKRPRLTGEEEAEPHHEFVDDKSPPSTSPIAPPLPVETIVVAKEKAKVKLLVKPKLIKHSKNK